MSVIYEYVCEHCNRKFETMVDSIADRDNPTKRQCIRCGKYRIVRVLSPGAFFVPEGSCGNAKNGYSSYHGDSANFKAGRKIY